MRLQSTWHTSTAWRRTLVLAALLPILVITLYPTTGPEAEATRLCMLCSRGAADFLLNVVLFLPFGAALTVNRASVSTVAVAGVSLSMGVELTQLLFLPGRDATPMDILANGTGAVAGWWAWTLLRSAHPARSKASGRTTPWIVALVTVAVLLGALQLFRPSYPDAVYYTQWTADFGDMATYDGQIEASSIGGVELGGPPWRIENSDTVRRLLERGAPIRVTARAGSAPTSLAPIFSIYDEEQREIFLIGTQFDHLVFRSRSLSMSLGLDQGDLRFRGSLAGVQPGTLVHLEVVDDDRGICMQVDDRRACGLGYAVGDTWMLLYSPRRFGAPARAVFTTAWLTLLFVPAGLMTRGRRSAWGTGAVVAAGLLVGPWLTGSVATPFWHVIASLVGVGIGAAPWRHRIVAALDPTFDKDEPSDS